MKRLLYTLAAAVFGIGCAALIAREVAIAPRIDPQAAYIEKEDPRPAVIDEYFKSRNMPLAGMGAALVSAADKNGLDWRLLPAIAVRESSGGIAACGHNPFGWASCRRSFDTWDEAITTVARHLGGNATSTRSYYGGKDTAGKLNAYNPPSIVPEYTSQVMAIMAQLGDN